MLNAHFTLHIGNRCNAFFSVTGKVDAFAYSFEVAKCDTHNHIMTFHKLCHFFHTLDKPLHLEKKTLIVIITMCFVYKTFCSLLV